MTVADLLAESRTGSAADDARPAPGTNLAARLAAAAAADAAVAAAEAAQNSEDHGGRVRRAVGWLFAPKGADTADAGTGPIAAKGDDEPASSSIEVEDELELDEALADSDEAPVRPWLRPRATPVQPRDEEAEVTPDPPEAEAAETSEASNTDVEDAAAGEVIRPGADLVRRLAEANASALSNTSMGTPPAMPEPVAPPARFPRLRRRLEPDDEPVPVTAPAEPLTTRVATPTKATKKPATPAKAADKPQGHGWRRLIVVIVIAAAAAIALRAYVIAPYYIPSASMERTLHGCSGCNNDHVLVDKLSYHLHDPRRGDVVVFHRPSSWNVQEKLLIKRVIGLPGDVLSAKDGIVYINGLKVQEPYVDPDCGAGTTNLATVTVPAGEVFVMGDNRCNSEDSRIYGPIKQSAIVGRAFVIVWPLGRIHWL